MSSRSLWFTLSQWVMPTEAKVPVKGKRKNTQSNKAIMASYGCTPRVGLAGRAGVVVRKKKKTNGYPSIGDTYYLVSRLIYYLYSIIYPCRRSMQYYYYYYIMLIIDPSDCQSPSTMVDYYSCAMYLSRCYVCLYRASREECGAPSATSATGSAVMSLQESRKLLSPVDCRPRGVTA